MKLPIHFQFSGRTAKNRLMKGPMAEALASWNPTVPRKRGIPSNAHVELYRRWGEGTNDWGVIVTGNISIAFDGSSGKAGKKILTFVLAALHGTAEDVAVFWLLSSYDEGIKDFAPQCGPDTDVQHLYCHVKLVCFDRLTFHIRKSTAGRIGCVMRLLNVNTMALELFSGQVPPYVILSHTWTSEEVTLQEFGQPKITFKHGWHKIVKFCDMIKKDGRFEYGWVDTCCIDKTSSAELSEAINAMFAWYRNAEECYVFLDDVCLDAITGKIGSHFEAARWFQRGWTLQELLAPQSMVFYDKNGVYMGTKDNLVSRISATTRVGEDILLSGNLSTASVAQKMSWAADRMTTRVEDIAYCLLGIFDVNMPMIYGEGDKAFVRLQEEILKETDDQSIFAWDASSMPASLDVIGVLAPSPEYFRGSANIEAYPSSGEPLTITNRGIQMEMPMMESGRDLPFEFMALSCFSKGDLNEVVSVALKKDFHKLNNFSRERMALTPVSAKLGQQNIRKICLQKRSSSKQYKGPDATKRSWLVRYDNNFEPIWGYPMGRWQHDPTTLCSTLDLSCSLTERVQSLIVFRETFSEKLFGLYFLLESLWDHSKPWLWELSESFVTPKPLNEMIEASSASGFSGERRNMVVMGPSYHIEVIADIASQPLEPFTPPAVGKRPLAGQSARGVWVDELRLSYKILYLEF
ncbi:hypothetical protein S40293_07071 [Stachybotrys chartarum IBT 40293]|nr:hypothetical protein S40293_07071 [Stachybotrys chartarum IBT 40293]